MNIIDRKDRDATGTGGGESILIVSGCAASSRASPNRRARAPRAPVDLADVAAVLDGNPRAVLFRTVGPERQELVGNVTGSRARIARAFGVAPSELLQEIQRRLRNKPEIVEVVARAKRRCSRSCSPATRPT